MMRWFKRLTLIALFFWVWLHANPATASPLTDRLSQFPDWQSKPSVQATHGDLNYPDWFTGTWNVTTTLVDLAAPLAPELVTPGFESNRPYLNQPIAFQARFIAPKPALWTGLGSQSARLIADRAFNGLNLAKAYLGDRPVLAVKVDPTNPNRQITLLRGDRQLVSTVTGRAIESPDVTHFVTSEVFQQEFRGTGQLYFNEVETTTAYTRQEGDRPDIVADQVTAIYLSPQDPDYFKAGDRPVALYRYRLEFEPAEN